MPIGIAIDDAQLKGFSPHACAVVETATKQYVRDLIDEANRLEAGRGGTAVPEVTAAMVTDARDSLGRGLGVAKKNWSGKVLKIASSVFSLLVGILYNETKLQSSGYLLVFVLVVACAILAVTLSTLKE